MENRLCNTKEANRREFMNQYAAMGAEVVDVVSRIKGTYGPTLRQVRLAAVLVKMVSFAIILLVIMMFVRMMIANQRNRISIKKAMGFRNLDIKKSFRKSCLPYILAGIIIGTICGCTLGESICGVALKSLGAVGFQFSPNMWSVTINILLGGLAAILAVYLGSNGIKNIKAVECCRGRE